MRYGRWVARRFLGLVLVGLLLCPSCSSGQPLAQGLQAWLEPRPLAEPTATLPSPLAPFGIPTLPLATLPPPSLAEPLVWAGGEGFLTVLSSRGWRAFEVEGIVRDIAIDQYGNAILAPGLRMCDGGLVRDLLPRAPGGEQDAVAVDPQGRIWVGYYGGIAVLEDGRWRLVPLAGPGDPGKAKMVRDLAIDSKGIIWVATGTGLARYDGATWRYYGEDTGLGAGSVDCLLIDRQDRVWAAHEKGLSVLAGNSWQHFPLDEVGFVQSLAADPAGRVLAGSLYHGVSLYDGQAWTTYASLEAGLPSDRITAVAVDALGRLWVGMRIGLSVRDGDRWLTYQEANSGLGDNQVSALAIGRGALTQLPLPGPLKYGRLVGRVTWKRQPLAGVRVTLCAELSLAQGFADNPCENAPSARTTLTRRDGFYAFEQVPVGHYAVGAEVKPGRWVTRARVLSAVRYAVRAGQTTEAETVEGAE